MNTYRATLKDNKFEIPQIITFYASRRGDTKTCSSYMKVRLNVNLIPTDVVKP
jgi:hypothetical protein